MRRLKVYGFGFLIVFLLADLNAETVSLATHNSSSASNRTDVRRYDLLQDLVAPAAENVTPREACALAGMALGYLQIHSSKQPMCAVSELTKDCSEIMKLSPGTMSLMTPQEVYGLQRKVPSILHHAYACVKKIGDAKLKEQFKSKNWYFEKKKELVKSSCELLGEIFSGGNDSSASDPSLADVDYQNPCRAIFKGSDSRLRSFFSTGGDVCKILNGNVELKDLIPPGIYDSSVAQNLPLDLPDYAKASLDGGIDVFKSGGVGLANDFVTRRVVTKAGASGAVALAAITAATKQIHLAAANGNNHWAHALGMDNLGACLAGGVPESHALARPKIVGGQTQIDCCNCVEDLYQNGWRHKLIRSDDYLAPIEDTDFGKTLCHDQQGKSRQKALMMSGGYTVYSILNKCQKVTVTGTSCVLTADTKMKPVRVIKEEINPFASRKSFGTRMDQQRRRDKPAPRNLYAPGHRPKDPAIVGERFQDVFAMPPALSNGIYRWPAPAAPIAANRMVPPLPIADAAPLTPQQLHALHGPNAPIALPDRDLRRSAKRPALATNVPVRQALEPIPLADAEVPQMAHPELPLPPRAVKENLDPLPPIVPAPDLEIGDAAKPNPPVAAANAPFPDVDLRKAIRPVPSAAHAELKRTPLPALKFDLPARLAHFEPLPPRNDLRASELEAGASMAPIVPEPDFDFPPVAQPTPEPKTHTADRGIPEPDLRKQLGRARPAKRPLDVPKRAVLEPLKLESHVPELAHLKVASPKLETKAAELSLPPIAVAPEPPIVSKAVIQKAKVKRTESPRTSPCACTKEWSSWKNNERWSLCVVRKNGNALSHTNSYLEDPNCAKSCHALYSDPRVSSACASTGAPVPEQQNLAKSNTAVPPPAAAATTCGCRTEWGHQAGRPALLCVMRIQGATNHTMWTPAYRGDESCRQGCQTLWLDSRSNVCFSR